MTIPLLLMGIAAVWGTGGAAASHTITGIYTLPFLSSYTKSCEFGCYSGHQGTDYQLGATSSPGEEVVAALGGTVKQDFQQGPDGAGNYVTVDHGDGNFTRYLHLQDYEGSEGSYASRGRLVGYEGNSGSPWCQDPPACTEWASPYHLHFETKIHGTPGNYNSGTAVDPYGVYTSGTYLWTTNPPAYPDAYSQFQSWLLQTPIGWSSIDSNWSTAVGDYNGDGVEDLYFIKRDPLEVHIRNGANQFQLPWLLQKSGVATWSSLGSNFDITLADYNNDGREDLYFIRRAPVEVHISDGASGYQTWFDQRSIGWSSIDSNWDTAAGDYNGDGVGDLYLIKRNPLEVHIRDGAIGFQLPWLLQQALDGWSSIGPNIDTAVADYNGDGVEDLYFVKRNPLEVHMRNGANQFQLPWLVQKPVDGWQSIDSNWDTAAGDYNGGGIGDLYLIKRGPSRFTSAKGSARAERYKKRKRPLSRAAPGPALIARLQARPQPTRLRRLRLHLGRYRSAQRRRAVQRARRGDHHPSSLPVHPAVSVGGEDGRAKAAICAKRRLPDAFPVDTTIARGV